MFESWLKYPETLTFGLLPVGSLFASDTTLATTTRTSLLGSTVATKAHLQGILRSWRLLPPLLQLLKLKTLTLGWELIASLDRVFRLLLDHAVLFATNWLCRTDGLALGRR